MPRALLLHARYRERGGEEGSFDAEARAFRALGWDVDEYVVQNAEHPGGFRGAARAIFNFAVFREVRRRIRAEPPDVMYVNNTWPALSAAPLLAARIGKIHTIQALRNYRLVVPSAKLLDDGSCISCGSRRGGWACVRKGCLSNSRALSLVAYLSSAALRLATKGWEGHVFVTPSLVSRELLIARGLSRRIVVRPNHFTSSTRPSFRGGSGAIYVGRLSSEKGVLQLVRNWPPYSVAPRLKVIGDGQLHDEVVAAAAANGNVEIGGTLGQSKVLDALRSSEMCVIPSTWAEPFGRVAIEAMSVGTPCITSAGGALPEVVGDAGVLLTGLDKEDLERAVKELKARNSDGSRKLAYGRYIDRFSESSATRNMQMILHDLIGVTKYTEDAFE